MKNINVNQENVQDESQNNIRIDFYRVIKISVLNLQRCKTKTSKNSCLVIRLLYL
jgi:hypothetical protein